MSIELMNRMREEFACPECKGVLVSSIAEIYCKSCGLVVDDSPVDDNDAEKDGDGNFTNARTGPPLQPWESISTLL